jgi:hypothetical protein
MDVASTVGRGTTLSLFFPRIDTEPAQASVPGEALPPRGGDAPSSSKAEPP